MANRFVNTDACGRPPASPALSTVAGYGQRYASLIAMLVKENE